MVLTKLARYKITLVTILTILSVVYLSVNHFAPTQYARNTYFYADYAVANQILNSGYVFDHSISVPNRWGKITTIQKTPILPVFLAILDLVTNTRFQLYYVGFPSMLLIIGSLAILLRRMGLDLLPSVVLAVSGSLIAPTTSYYPISINTVSLGVLFLGVSILAILLDLRDEFKTRASIIALFPILLIFLFYRYPPHFVILFGIIILVSGANFKQRKRFSVFYSVLTIGLLILLQIFELPLNAYVNYLRYALLNLATFQIIDPTVAFSSAPPTVYEPRYYSLIPGFVLIPISFIGGCLYMIDFYKNRDRKQAIPLAWGLIVICISVAYILTSTGWLVGRGYFFAIPVMLLGVGRVLHHRSIRTNSLICLVILLMGMMSLVLQLGIPVIGFHSYEPGINEGAEWAGEYSNSEIHTGHKIGAAMAAKWKFNGRYPKDYNEIEPLFYTENYSLFKRTVESPIMLSRGMTEYGFRAAGFTHRPMSESAYEIRMEQSDVIYQNGNSVMILEL